MSTLRQAAVLLASLPADDSAALLARLDSAQSQAVQGKLARLAIADDELQTAFNEFARDNRAATSLVPPSLAALARGLTNQDLRDAIVDEHPQTIAAILGSLSRQRGIQLLATLPKDLQLTVVRKIAATKEVDPDVLRIVADGLASKIARTKGRRAAIRAA